MVQTARAQVCGTFNMVRSRYLLAATLACLSLPSIALAQQAYSSSTIYTRGQTAVYGGVTYTSVAGVNIGNIPSSTSQYWAVQTTGGPGTGATAAQVQAIQSASTTAAQALAASTLNPRGAWAANTAYAVGDSFTNGGVSYVVASAFTSGSTFTTANVVQGVSGNITLAAASAAVAAAQADADAQKASVAAAAAHAGAPHYPVVNYGTAQTCTWKKTLLLDATGQYIQGVSYTGGVDDHAAIQAAQNAAGSFVNVPTMDYGGLFHNAPQGTVVYPEQAICQDLTGSILPAPGTAQDGNGTEVHFALTGHGFDLQWPGPGVTNSTYGYGRFFDLLRNLIITGPGTATSMGKALHLQLANHAYIENVTGAGFKYGLSGNQMQYTFVMHSAFNRNQVNCYVAADPANLALPSIDNVFEGTDCNNGTRFGLWQQTGVGNRYLNGDYGFNGSAEILIGGQVPPYVAGVSVTGGVATPNSYVQFTFADSGGAQYSLGKGYYVTNSSGAATGTATITNAGMGITNAVFTVTSAGVTTQPTFGTPTYRNDQTATGIAAIGDYQGDQYGNGDISLLNIKGESSANAIAGQFAPDTGFFDIFGTPGTVGSTTGITFYHPDNAIDSLASYAHQMRFYGTGNNVLYPNHVNGSDPGKLTGSTAVSDFCDYQITQNGPEVSVAFSYGSGITETNINRQACDGKFAAANPANFTYLGYATNGNLLTPGLNFGGANLNVTDTAAPVGGVSTGVANASQSTSPQIIARSSIPAFTLSFISTGAAGTIPTLSTIGKPSTVGIPSGQVCNAIYRWAGGGTNATNYTYDVTASCNDGNANGVTSYLSPQTVLGSEAWVSLNEQVASLGYFTLDPRAALSVVNLTGNITFRVYGTLGGILPVTWAFCQDSVGGHTFTVDSTYAKIRGMMTITTAPNTCSVQQFIWSSTLSAYLALTPGVTNQ